VKENKMKKRTRVILIGLLAALLVGAGVVVVAVPDLRGALFGAAGTGACESAYKQDGNADPSYTYTAPAGYIVCKVKIKAGSAQSGGGEWYFTGDGCQDGYCASGLGTGTATASRSCTEGPDCHAISHSQFWIQQVQVEEEEPTATPTATSTPEEEEEEEEPTATPTATSTPEQTIIETGEVTPTPTATPTEKPEDTTPAEATSTPAPSVEIQETTEEPALEPLLPESGEQSSFPTSAGIVLTIIGVIALLSSLLLSRAARRRSL
jgi:hypothetical protein